MRKRTIPGYPGYLADAAGRIYSRRTGGVLSPGIVGRGYHKVTVHAQQRYVHRLVALAFHGAPPTPKHEVAHRNGIRTDNRAVNLSWKTRSENHHDKTIHGTMPRPGARLTVSQVREIRRRYTPRKGVGILAAEFGVGAKQIRRIAKGIQWQNLSVI